MSAQKKKSGGNYHSIAGDQICFGFDRSSDEQSLYAFLRTYTKRKTLHTLIPRLDDAEISALVDFLTALLQKHLTEEEYHQLFLPDSQT